jgi:glycosyltransferase involved in cell wall biosynthesis
MSKKIFIITGPGNHSHLLLDMFRKTNYNVYYSEYYPSAIIYKLNSKKNEDKVLKKKTLYTHLEKTLGGIKRRLKLKKNFGNYLLFNYYDNFVSDFLRKNQFDLLIAWPQVSLQSIKTAKKFGTIIFLEYPLIHVLTWQTIMVSEYKKLNISKSYNLFKQRTINKMLDEINSSDHINVLSQFAQNSFIDQKINKEIISIIPPGVDIYPLTKKYKNIKPIILFVGRLDCLKGVHNLIASFQRITECDAELWLIGYVSTEILPFLKNINSNIKVLGERKKNELADIYRQSDILVLPSIQESFGMVLLEALSNGLYIIGSKNSGAPDIIGGNINLGVLFDPFDKDDLFEKLKFSLRRIQDNQTNSYDPKQILEKFSFKKYQDSYLAQIKSLCKENI